MDNNDTVIIQLDRPRELRLSHKVLKKFLATHNTDMEHMEEYLQGYNGACDILLLMLQREDPSLTEEQLDDLLDAPGVNLMDVFGKVYAAMSAAFGEPEETANPPKRPARGTGRKA